MEPDVENQQSARGSKGADEILIQFKKSRQNTNKSGAVPQLPQHSALVGLLVAIYRWFSRLFQAASKQRKFYRQEQGYTVADNDPDDSEAIRMKNLPVICILCSPGSPITSLMYNIADSYNWYYLNIGALLQREISLETRRPEAVAHLMHRGVTLPRAFIFEVIRKQMANLCKKGFHKGFLFVDFPSTYAQAKDFFDYVVQPDFILYLRFSERTSLENLCIYLRYQVRASKILRKLQPDVYFVATEQLKKFKREIQLINTTFNNRFKIIDSTQSVPEFCKDIMKWIERATVIHHLVPPLFVAPPLPFSEA